MKGQCTAPGHALLLLQIEAVWERIHKVVMGIRFGKLYPLMHISPRLMSGKDFIVTHFVVGTFTWAHLSKDVVLFCAGVVHASD